MVVINKKVENTTYEYDVGQNESTPSVRLVTEPNFICARL